MTAVLSGLPAERFCFMRFIFQKQKNARISLKRVNPDAFVITIFFLLPFTINHLFYFVKHFLIYFFRNIFPSANLIFFKKGIDNSDPANIYYGT